MKPLLLTILIGATVAGCHSHPTIEFSPPAPDGDILGGQDCDSLVPTQCGYPYPSSVYLVNDPSTMTGKHIQYRATTLPLIGGVPTNPATFTRYDGFSPSTAALTHLPGATTTGLPDQNNIALSVTTQSPTILMEVNRDGTWRLIPHFAELDVSTLPDPYDPPAAMPDQTFMIHPAVRLNDNTRYIVAIRHVVDVNGNEIQPSPAFQALRDGTSSSDASVTARRGLYQNIFNNLAVAGISSKDLQIAWDYYTTSRENVTSDLLTMRDAALAAVGPQGPTYTKTTITLNPDPYIAKRIEGTMHVPLFLTSTTPGALLNRDASGKPVQNGWADFPYLVQIPNSLVNGTMAPAGVLQNGHGLLGSRTEGEDDYFARLPDDGGYVGIAVDLWGFNTDYISVVTEVIGEDVGNFLQMVEGQHQGLINELLAMRMMIGGFANDPDVIYNGKSVIDPTKRYWRGDSQGGIMGTTYMAISTDVTRGYLGEPGFPYNLLLNRSGDFYAYFLILTSTYSGPRLPQLMLGLIQQQWDRTEPTGYAPYVTQNMLEGTPQHAVMIDDGIGDFQVTPLGAHILARTVGAVQLTPVNRHIFGINEVAGPLPAGSSAITEFNFQLDQNPNVILPITDASPEVTGSGLEDGMSVSCDPHDKIREETAVFKEQELFFGTGQIQTFCTGQSLRPAGDDIPGSCQFDYTIPYTPAATPSPCSPG